MDARKTLAIAGALIALATVLGAFGAHALKAHLSQDKLLVYETAHASGTRFVGGATQDSCCFSRRELVVETMLTRRRRGLPTLHQLGCAGRASDVRWWRGGRDRDGP